MGKKRRKRLSILLLAVLLMVNFCGCNLLTQNNNSNDGAAAITFNSVKALIDYINDNNGSAEGLNSLISEGKYLNLYEPKFLPKKYKIESISLESNSITLIYETKKDTDRSSGEIKMSWDLSGNGKAKMRSFIKDHKDINRVNNNIDVFFSDDLDSSGTAIGKYLYWEQEDKLFTAYLPQKIYEKVTKDRNNLINPATLTRFDLNKFEKANKAEEGNEKTKKSPESGITL